MPTPFSPLWPGGGQAFGVLSGRLDGPACEGRRSVLPVEPAPQVAEPGSVEAEPAVVPLEFVASLQLSQLSLRSGEAFEYLVLHFGPPSMDNPLDALDCLQIQETEEKKSVSGFAVRVLVVCRNLI